MHRTRLGLVVAVLTLAGGCSGLAAAAPPSQPGADERLSENGTAGLWSKTPNPCLPAAEHRSAGEDASKQALASCTELTFKQPPRTARQWTTDDFQSLTAGGPATSVYPEHADRDASRFIKDAHATIFAVQPSTILHGDADGTTLYLAPDGDLRALVDYRVHVPADATAKNQTIEWTLLDHEIEAIRLTQDGDLRSRQDGQHTPTVAYELDGAGPSTLAVEAAITAELEQTITERVGNQTRTRSERLTDNITVSQEVDATVYNLTATVYQAAYPDGDAGVAIYQSQPWHGYQLTADEEASVRGVWRYYTARDTDWDTLVHGTETGTEVVAADARPVYTHAFPSEVGPRAEPIHDGPTIQAVWGRERDSPAPTVHDDVEIGIVDAPYERSYGLAVRTEAFDRDELVVQGIVHGTVAKLTDPDDGTHRAIRESELTTELLERTHHEVTVRIELRDAETGAPIALADAVEDRRRAPIGGSRREGYITIGDKRVTTNASGVGVVTLDQPGPYTAVYHPGSWRTHDPAYVGDRSSLSWHPLLTARGWVALLLRTVWAALPFAVALYAGMKLGSFLRASEVT